MSCCSNCRCEQLGLCNNSENLDELATGQLEEAQLMISIVRARGLHSQSWFPGPEQRELYCTIGIAGLSGTLYSTRHVKDTLQPCWREEAKIQSIQEGRALDFSIWDCDSDGSANLVGKAILGAERFQGDGFNGELQLRQGKADLDAWLKVKVHSRGQKYPEGPMEEFTLVIESGKKKVLGVDFDCQDDTTMHVVAVKAGLMMTYNKMVEPERQVTPGDFIMKVNGVEGDSTKLVERIKQDTRLELVVRRPTELVVAIGTATSTDFRNSPRRIRTPKFMPRFSCTQAEPEDRCQDYFGMQLKDPFGYALVVTRVMAGLVEDWNTENPEQAVRSGDRIVAVNGRTGLAVDLLKWIKASERFHMTIVRPSNLEGFVRDVRVPPLPLHQLEGAH
mmetsp:Transcript_73388/g.170241  ORF Transcript_73388/g.170241 Transcript_73388/m.170241 type:complete len:391 (+) Transcript_73388:145-1317(+)|eukprot:CAMPEP_0171110990 /NCGR_PEP_ID=MMETSP0766_2-20121228/73251_1 /TAXON_ID=439317 /ORGANISM="Gambierdiscus australes, Strain CAWD 149" /LENGTH=390 /DNA_ID=CAMNT_0011572921 /DNA_START=59 /DNA_END=1231 /DNA_ORIENTATION=+